MSTETCKVSDLRYSGTRQQLNSKPRPVEIPVRLERYLGSFNCAELSNAFCALVPKEFAKELAAKFRRKATQMQIETSWQSLDRNHLANLNLSK